MNNVLNFEEEKIELNLLGKINQLLEVFDEIDNMMGEIPEKTSHIELLRSDLEHLLEDKDMGSIGYKNIARELERVRKQRRHLKKAYEVSKCFKENRTRIMFPEQRDSIREALSSCFENLQTEYHYRLLNADTIISLIGDDKYKTKDEINNEIKDEKLGRKKYSKVNVPVDDLRNYLEQGLSYKMIGNIYGVSAGKIANLKKKHFPNETFNEVGSRGSKGSPIRRKEGAIRPREVTLEMYRELEEKGYNQRQMAEHWGFGTSSITDIKKRLGIEVIERPNYHRG